MYISNGASRIYGQNAYKIANSTAKAKISANKALNTDKAEFSAISSADEKILPERYKDNGAKLYYKGNIVTEYQLLETAVRTGAMTLDETKSVHENMSKAVDLLIGAKASPVSPSSGKLYSEDGKYVMTVENGHITRMSKAWFDDGTTILDVAKDLANGVRPCDIDPCKRDWLASCDPELYKAACDIGSAKRSYFQETQEYENGHLTKQQYIDEMYPIFLLFLGDRANVLDLKQHSALRNYMNSPDFGEKALGFRK